MTDKIDHIEKAYPTSNTTWVWWLLQGIYLTKQSYLVMGTKHLNAHFFLNPVKRDVLWSSLISQYQESQNVCHETRPNKFESLTFYFCTEITKNSHCFIIKWIELIDITWGNRVFQDARFCQIIWQIFKKGRAKTNCQKMPPVGIEPRASWSSL